MDSILNWIGGKSNSCKKIVELMPEHFCYVEAFCGACWILLEKPISKSECINDVNGELINLWRVIQKQPNEFKEREKYEMYSRELFDEYYIDFYNGTHSKMTNLERSFRFFCMIKEAYASKFGNVWGYGQSRNQANAFFNEFKLIDIVAERLKHVQIENRDFQKVIDGFDSETTLFVFDPPYIKADVDTQYFKALGANNIIGFNLSDHQRLYKAITNLKGKFILTIDNDPFIRERYCDGEQGSRGFWWIDNTVFYSSADKDNRRHVTELIITNYDTNEVIKQNKLKLLKEEEKRLSGNTKSLLDY